MGREEHGKWLKVDKHQVRRVFLLSATISVIETVLCGAKLEREKFERLVLVSWSIT